MRFDLIVVGGGVVGASIARAVRGMSVALVSGGRPPSAQDYPPGEFDARVYALSPGSVEFLRSIRVWDAIAADRLTPVHAMQVFGDSEGARIGFDAYRGGVAELAWIVEDRVLQAALWNALGSQDGLELFVPSRCESLESGERATLRLADGRRLEADLVVGADGADSFVRNAAGIEVAEMPYGQTAVVANFSCAQPHRNAAYQWFQAGPVLALLPLPRGQVSMVWSVPEQDAARLMTLDAGSLGEAVTAASHGVLGTLSSVTAPQAYPLRRINASRMVAPHVALAGDAAHVIHPLAGQGLNLGLQDAQSLGAVLQGRAPVRSAGDFHLLRRYERDRSEAILAMRTAVHGLQAMFESGSPSVRRLRSLGLNFTDRLPVIKNLLLRHALH